MTDTARPRAVVSLSGGMDSVVCAALAARDFETYAVHFSYGQRTENRELLAAQDAVRLRDAINTLLAANRPRTAPAGDGQGNIRAVLEFYGELTGTTTAAAAHRPV